MKKQFLVCFLQHRQNLNAVILAFLHLHLALQTNPQLAKKVKIVITCTQHKSNYLRSLVKLFSSIYDIELLESPAFYSNKIKHFIAQYPPNHFRYFIKHDEDLIVSPQTWVRLLTVAPQVLKNPLTTLLTINLSTGIPSWYNFGQVFLSKKERKQILSFLAKTKIPGHLWQKDYSPLSNYLKSKTTWQENKYWQKMNTLATPFKGLHPIRIYLYLPFFINSLVLNRFVQFQTQKVSQRINKVKDRYLCNSFFIMEYKLYQKIFEDKSLYLDTYDEIPVNLYKNRIKGHFAFLADSLGVHYLYNSVYDQNLKVGQQKLSGREVEDWLISQFVLKTSQYLKDKGDPFASQINFYHLPLYRKLVRTLRKFIDSLGKKS